MSSKLVGFTWYKYVEVGGRVGKSLDSRSGGFQIQLQPTCVPTNRCAYE